MINPIKLVLSDFDGTLTDINGNLTGEFHQVIDLLQNKSIPLVIVSGRSLSWGHFFLTHLPLRACIMEGGGVYIVQQDDGFWTEKLLVTEAELAELQSCTQKLLDNFKSIKLAADSFGRKTDRAIDHAELKDGNLKSEVKEFLKEHKLNFSESSVHLNFWKGDVSKAKGSLHFLNSFYPDYSIDDCVFFGDAPNDESMFFAMPHSVGVKNIEKYISELDFKPAKIAAKESVSGVLDYLTEALKQ